MSWNYKLVPTEKTLQYTSSMCNHLLFAQAWKLRSYFSKVADNHTALRLASRERNLAVYYFQHKRYYRLVSVYISAVCVCCTISLRPGCTCLFSVHIASSLRNARRFSDVEADYITLLSTTTGSSLRIKLCRLPLPLPYLPFLHFPLSSF